MPGPRPKPTYLKLLAGNPGGRPLPVDEPEPSGDLLDPPAYFSAHETRVWRYHIENAPVGLLKKLDTNALERYCVATAKFEVATTRIAKQGMVIATKGGQFMHNPFLAIQNAAFKQMRQCSDELGFSPASRTRVHISKPKKPNSMFRKLRDLNID